LQRRERKRIEVRTQPTSARPTPARLKTNVDGAGHRDTSPQLSGPAETESSAKTRSAKRVSLGYVCEAWDSREKLPPKGGVTELAAAMGVELLTEEQ
jgi:hypothetical protein